MKVDLHANRNAKSSTQYNDLVMGLVIAEPLNKQIY